MVLLEITLDVRLVLAVVRHVHLAARGPRQREEAVGPGRAGQRGVPPVAQGELLRQSMKRGQVARLVVAHDVGPLGRGRFRIGLRKIAHEAAVVIGQLRPDVLDLVVRVIENLARLGRRLLEILPLTVGIDAGILGADAVDLRVDRLQASQHLVEGVVFQNQNDDMLDGIRRLVVCHGLNPHYL